MYEKVNPAHPDKVADRLAGAIVDLAYKIDENPKIAVEILLGHKECHILIESSVELDKTDIAKATIRIIGHPVDIYLKVVPQDPHLADNQSGEFRCGDNGIFKGTPISGEEADLTEIAEHIYDEYKTDGKYILDGDRLIICQSYAADELKMEYPEADVNPLGEWTGGIDVDAGATNRKIGSDMGAAATGGGLHGKDLSKADVSANIYAHLKAEEAGHPVEFCCAIGDDTIDGKPYSEIVEVARKYINDIGGFEKFAEWGLIR